MTVAGFQLEKKVTVANVIQIGLLIGMGGLVLVTGYIERRDTQAQVVALENRLNLLDANRNALIEKNENRLKGLQDAINSQEVRLNVAAETALRTQERAGEVADELRDRIGELADEIRSLNAYLRQSGYSTPRSKL
jgi:hypothetical protein